MHKVNQSQCNIFSRLSSLNRHPFSHHRLLPETADDARGRVSSTDARKVPHEMRSRGRDSKLRYFLTLMRIYTMILWVVLGISWHRYHQIYDLQDKHTRTLLIVCKLFPLIMNERISDDMIEIVPIFAEDFYRINERRVCFCWLLLYFHTSLFNCLEIF